MTHYSHIERQEKQILSKKPLVKHLKEVAETCQNYVVHSSLDQAKRAHIEETAYWIGMAHDFGKFTTFFQEYLLLEKNTGMVKHHSFISAFWGAYLVYKIQKPPKELEPLLLLLAFGAILYHHGQIDCFVSLLYEDLDDYRKDPDIIDPHIKRKLDTLFKRHIPDLLKQEGEITKELASIHSDFPKISEFVRELNPEKGPFYEVLFEAGEKLDIWISKENGEDFHYFFYLLFSSLIDADKRDAAGVLKEVNRPSLTADLVKDYKNRTSFFQAQPELNKMREAIFQNVATKARELSLQQRLFTLTAPTGSGKTLAALNFALELRKRIQEERGYTPRIIYSLPFTSIIDQNFEVIEKVLSPIPDYAKNQSHYLLKHHHLAKIQFQSKQMEEESLPLDKSLLLIESWNSEIIVTTFIQFFYSIIGNRNRFLKKFHNLTRSIIILDEIQNIPIEYWELVEKTLKWLAERGDCRILLMTATQPLIFSSEDAEELVSHPEENFKNLHRIEVSVDLEKKTMDHFFEELKRDYQKNKSCALILNTIQSSLDMHKKIKEGLSFAGPLYYLSSNIIPKHRKGRIGEIKKLLQQGKPVLLVTTQVIEAGVDLDFDIVYRDLAPLDSIVQSAGRANRNGNQLKGLIKVINLVDDRGREFGSMIYGKAHLWVAKKLLQEHHHLSENQFYNLVQENYGEVFLLSNPEKGREIFRQWLQKFNYEALQDFRLIEEKGQYVDVFIAFDSEAREVWNGFVIGILKEKDFRKRQNNYLQIRRDLRQYILSIPLKLAKLHFWDYCQEDISKIGYVGAEPEMLKDYYNEETGFKRNDDSGIFF